MAGETKTFLTQSESDIKILYEVESAFSNAVADQEKNQSFFKSSIFQSVIEDQYDLVLGTKGSGKSKLYLELKNNQRSYSELKDVTMTFFDDNLVAEWEKIRNENLEILRSVNNETQKISEVESALKVGWKIFFASSFLQQLKKLSEENKTIANLAEVKEALKEGSALAAKDGVSPLQIVWSALPDLLAGAAGMVNPLATFAGKAAGVFLQKIEWFKTWTKKPADITSIFDKIDKAFESAKKKGWILLDRLDGISAFQEYTHVEAITLRSLLNAYKDLFKKQNIRLKIFLRSDIFNLISKLGRFTEIDHLRKSPVINWSKDELLALFLQRIPRSAKKKFRDSLNSTSDFADIKPFHLLEHFGAFFQAKKGRQNTWDWMYESLQDGNEVVTPRDLFFWIYSAALEQKRKPTGDNNNLTKSGLIDLDVFEKAFEKVSLVKRDVFRGEYDFLKETFQKFADGKAKHTENTLKSTLGASWSSDLVEQLILVGFLKKTKNEYEIPKIFRPAFNITQGSASRIEKADREVMENLFKNNVDISVIFKSFPKYTPDEISNVLLAKEET